MAPIVSTKVGKITFNRSAVESLTVPAAAKASKRIVSDIQDIVRKAGRVDRGDLLNSFTVDTDIGPRGVSFTIDSTAPHALWVDQGTGVYGPKGSPIVPTSARALRFNPSKKSSPVGRRGVTNSPSSGRFQSAYVFAPSVKGQQGISFMERAQSRIRLTYFL